MLDNIELKRLSVAPMIDSTLV